MHEPSGFRGRQLASSPTSDVRVCEHGIVHLTLGAPTLRLSKSPLHHAAATLEAATRALDARPVGPERSARRLC